MDSKIFSFNLLIFLSILINLSFSMSSISKISFSSSNIQKDAIKNIDSSFLFGIENTEEYSSLFSSKRIGLITNPTGILQSFESSIDFLYRSFNLTSLYAPEHGIRGNTQAGGSISEETDIKTGLPVYSLYGKNLKPSKEMLSNIDILCIDIQDVGSRFYTYIYTMANAMQACKEYGKKFVVFDRPNPVSANLIDGNILEEEFKSFVGMYPIISRHGLTIGELASLFNKEFEINCDLEIIKMKNYYRNYFFDDIILNNNKKKLQWVNPSPNMPSLSTALVYGGTCLFEGTNISEGRGTTKPFEYIGAPFIDPFELSDKLNELMLSGVVFRPIYFTPTDSKYKGEQCAGVQVHVTNKNEFLSYKTGVAMVYTIKKLYGEKVEFQEFLKKLMGSDLMFKYENISLEEMFYKINIDVRKFMEVRNKYLIYPFSE